MQDSKGESTKKKKR